MRGWWLLLMLGCAEPAVASEPVGTKTLAERDAGHSATVLAEARLLARMRAGLETGDVDDAWDAVVDHEQRFADGELWPDREVFAIAILVQQGEHREAQLRAETFLETHDNCAHGQRVRVLIAGLAPY